MHFRGKRSLLSLLLSSILTILMSVGCSKSTTPANTPSITGLSSGITTAQKNLAKAQMVPDTQPTAFNWVRRHLPGIQNLFLPEVMASSLGSLSAFWTTATAAQDLYNGGNSTGYTGSGFESPKNWMGQELDPGFTNSGGAATTPFGRSAMAFFLSCILGAVTEQTPALTAALDTDNLLKVGSYSATINFASATSTSLMGCAFPASIPASQMSTMGSITMDIAVTAVSPATTYTKQYAITWSTGDNGPPPMTVMLKLDTTNQILNFIEQEQSNPGHGGWGIDRQILAVNGNVTDYEYTSQSYNCGSVNNGTELYRFHIDTTKNVGYVFGNYGAFSDDGSQEMFTRYILAGTPNSPSSVALSMAMASPSTSSSSPTYTNNGGACVSASTGSILTDASLSCDTTGVDVTASSLAESQHTAHASTATSYTVTYPMDATAKIPWSTFDTNASTGMFAVASE